MSVKSIISFWIGLIFLALGLAGLVVFAANLQTVADFIFSGIRDPRPFVEIVIFGSALSAIVGIGGVTIVQAVSWKRVNRYWAAFSIVVATGLLAAGGSYFLQVYFSGDSAGMALALCLLAGYLFAVLPVVIVSRYRSRSNRSD